MPNVIKYSESTETQALRSGNFYLGVGDVGKGPTESSGYWNGISPPVSGYTVYLNKATQGPSIYTPNNDSDLITITNMIGGTSFTSVTQCFNWYNTQNDKMVVNKDYPAIVTDGLVLNLDASFRPSYSGSGTTWYDVGISGKTGLLYNGPVFDNNGWIIFDGTDDISYGWSNTLSTPTTECGLEMLVNIITPSFWGQLFYIGVSSFNHNMPYVAFYTSSNSLIFGTNKQSGGFRGVHAVSLLLTNYTNRWIHIFGKMSDGILSMFLNGNQVGTYNLPNGYFTELAGQNVFVGGGLSTGFVSDVNCYVNYVRTYNRALSQQEVKQNFYGGNIVTNGLIQYLDASNLVSYPLTGTALTDMSGYGNSATLVNGASYKINTVPCISLDGTDDKITITNKDLSGLTYNIQYDINWTLACWIYVKTYDSSPQTYKLVYGNYNGCNYTALKGNGDGIIIYNPTSQGTIYLALGFGPRNNPSGSQCPGIGVSWSNAQVGSQLWGLQNRWAYFVITSDDGTNYKLYIDGVQVGPTKTVDFKNSQTRTDNQLTSTSQYAWGNAGGNNNAAIKADFAICQVYNRALTALEIQQNFNAQRNRFRV